MSDPSTEASWSLSLVVFVKKLYYDRSEIREKIVKYDVIDWKNGREISSKPKNN